MADVINLVQSRTGLTANGRNQELILAYIEQNASDVLIEKIKKSRKTLGQCMNFIISQAKKKAFNNCAMVEDKEVFGWAMHYFEEDSVWVDEIKTPAAKIVTQGTVKKPEPVKKETVKKEPAKAELLVGQMNFFDFLGGGNENT